MTEEKCECPVNPKSPYPNIRENDVIGDPELKELYFGTVKFGKRITKTFKLRNNTNNTLSYTIKRDPNVNPIYRAYEFRIRNTSVRSGQFLELQITYCPKVPSNVDIDYILLADSESNFYTVQLRGQCKSFSCNISATRLHFYKGPGRNDVKSIVELKNYSDMKMYYQFEKIGNGSSFMIDKSRGVLSQKRHEYISFKFIALKVGLHYCHVYCLNSYSEPIVIELIGYITEKPNCQFEKINFSAFPLENTEWKSYCGYLHDLIKTADIIPPFTLGKTYFDFGKVEENTFNEFNSRQMVTSVTNNMDSEICICFEHDSEVFKVNPKTLTLCSFGNAIIEVNFQPTKTSKFYLGTIAALVEWIDIRRSTVNDPDNARVKLPLLASLSALGNTFSDEGVWIPHVEIIPNIIVLPITVPNSKSFTTFIIKNKSHLPASFKFLPPSHSNLTLKPMLGVIKDFQIVVVQLRTDSTNRKQYVECWAVELNGSKKRNGCFYLKGYAEIPRIDVGVDNNVNFGIIQSGCEVPLDVRIKNKSGHFIEYNFQTDEHKHITIDQPQGSIAANDVIHTTWHFRATFGASTFSKMTCELRPIYQMQSVRGGQILYDVNVYATFAYSQLCALPREWTCEAVLYGETKVVKFNLFNFGKSCVYFLLNVAHNEDDRVTVMPSNGSLEPNQRLEAVAYVNARSIGQCLYTIYYNERKNANAAELIDEKGIDLYKIRFNCVMPYLQITDISHYTFGALFARAMLWKMLNVNGINAALKKLTPNETREVHLFMPDCGLTSKYFSLALLMKNTSNYDIPFVIKRKKLCDCQPVETTKAMTLRKIVYECPHRKLLDVQTQNETFQASSTMEMLLTMHYNYQGDHTLCHRLQMSFGRVLEIYTRMRVLTVPVEIASTFDQDFILDFGNCFIGAQEQFYKVLGFYLYNNSEHDVSYITYLDEVKLLNENYNFDVVEYANEDGVVKGNSLRIIYFKFNPIEAGHFEVKIPIFLGNELQILKLCCEGVRNTNGLGSQTNDTSAAIETSRKYHEEMSVLLSQDEIVIAPMLTHSWTRKLLFIRNTSKEHIIGYSFKPFYSYDDFVEVKFTNAKHTLQPKEMRTIIMDIRSFDRPIKCRLQVPCKLLNHTLYIEFKKKEARIDLMRGNIETSDTSDDEIETSKNIVEILPKPEFFYKIICIDVDVREFNDRDNCLDINSQLQNSPFDILELRHLTGVEPRCETAEKRHITLQQKDFSETTTTDSDKCICTEPQRTPLEQYEFYRDVLEYCMGDVMFSKCFYKTADITAQIKSPYYNQFKLDVECTGDNCKNTLYNDFVMKSKPATVAAILTNLVTDGIHELLQLGPLPNETADTLCEYEVSIPRYKI